MIVRNNDIFQSGQKDKTAMKKKIWILNHYAANMMYEKGGRHYWMAKELQRQGYQPVIFCADTLHNADKGVKVKGAYGIKKREGITFVIVKTPPYKGNGISRICNMIGFYKNVKKVMKRYMQSKAEKPDVILASHVHPLTCAAGIQFGRKQKIPCIVEIRDIWPAELIEIGAIEARSPAAKILLGLEKYLYEKADALIFTMEGAREYIRDKKWDREHGGPVDLKKVFYINNGVDIKAFEKNALRYPSNDTDLTDGKHFNLVYTGSIRRTNQIDLVLDMAKELQDEPKIQVLLWGAGDFVEGIEKRIQREKIKNVKYKGSVEKQEVPGILQKSDINLVHWKNMDILKYGYSYNKLFEYLAAGRPVFSTVHTEHSIIRKNNCGVETEGYTPKEFATEVKSIFHMPKEQREQMGKNAKEAAKQYDFSVLTERLIKIVEML